MFVVSCLGIIHIKARLGVIYDTALATSLSDIRKAFHLRLFHVGFFHIVHNNKLRFGKLRQLDIGLAKLPSINDTTSL